MTLFEYALKNKEVKRDLFVEASDKYSEYHVTVKEYELKYGQKDTFNGHVFEFNSSNTVKIDEEELLKGQHMLVTGNETIEFTLTYNKMRGYGFYAIIKIATC